MGEGVRQAFTLEAPHFTPHKSPHSHLSHTHRCTDSSLNTLNNMYGYSAMEMQEAFVKIKEQAKAYLVRPMELQVGRW